MVHEQNQQIATEGRAGRTGDRQGSPAAVLSSLQPQEVHPAAVVRLSGPQRVLQDRLSRHRGDTCRPLRPARGLGPQEGPPLDHPSKGVATSLAQHPGAEAAGRHRRPRQAATATQTPPAREEIGRRLQRFRGATSHYFVRRREKGGKHWQSTTYRRFPKLAVLSDCSSHLVLAAVPERGPGPDITHFERIVRQACPRVRMETLLADAGYDAEWVHRLGRDDLGITTIIPAKIGRPTEKAPTGYYRRWMSQRIHLTSYGQRWQAETTISMIKRRLGSAVNARTYWSQCRALMLKAVAHNILILYAHTELRSAAA